MNSLKHIIEETMKEKKPSYECASFFLYIISLLYGVLLWLRRILYQKAVAGSEKLPCVVVSVGNLTAGGSGKTPMTIHIAELFSRNGYKVSIISRGYKGRFEKSGGIVSDGKTIFADPSDAGDEPYMMAKKTGLSVICGRNRYFSGLEALKMGAEIVIMDDGFQHLALERDINILLMDWEKPVGNGYVIPRGLMRERISAVADADAVVMTRSLYPWLKNVDEKLKKLFKGKPVFYSRHSQYIALGESCYEAGKNVVVVSGLADNSVFIESVVQSGLIISDYFSFADHHSYSKADYERIVNEAIAARVDTIVTTEKDYVKLAGFVEGFSANGLNWLVLGVIHDFGEKRKEFENWLLGKAEALIIKRGLRG